MYHLTLKLMSDPLPDNLIKCEVRTGTVNSFRAPKLLVSYHCIPIQFVKCLQNIANMHVRERHENTHGNVTFYRYVLEYIWQRNVVHAIFVLVFK